MADQLIKFINVVPPDDGQKIDNYPDYVKKYLDACSSLNFSNTLITTGPERFDPWTIAQLGMERNEKFSPIIAINPTDHTPVLVAKKVLSLQSFYPNKLSLNLVSGAYLENQKKSNDSADFISRSRRLLEFYKSVEELVDLKNGGSFQGEFYEYDNCKILRRSKRKSFDYFLSGSFAADLQGSHNVNYLQNMKPLKEMKKAENKNSGLNIGIFVRDSAEQAQIEFGKKYVENRLGQMNFELSFKHLNTPWMKWLKEYIEKNEPNDFLYNLLPIKNSLSAAPFLVGSFQEVYERLKAYNDLGYNFLILDFDVEEVVNIRRLLDMF